ncbi:MAG: carboxypeptidase-like regulatory domain-containing protein [Gemmataceae bacterium]|nr:carboxypeptidase-like regulatory domain-containing protein [Gemmataceae bacterium]MDW8242942.1 carboxypeptidase-like regulatory domain-containing protein [Thermogemmata sp.]
MAGLLLPAGPVLAHALEAVVRVMADQIVIEAGYDDETPAEQARVVVWDEQGQVVAEGRTDARGLCRLPRPAAGRYRLEVTAVGHRTTVDFEVAEQPGEHRSWRPDRRLGLLLGLAGLLALSGLAWWHSYRRRRRLLQQHSLQTTMAIPPASSPEKPPLVSAPAMEGKVAEKPTDQPHP